MAYIKNIFLHKKTQTAFLLYHWILISFAIRLHTSFSMFLIIYTIVECLESWKVPMLVNVVLVPLMHNSHYSYLHLMFLLYTIRDTHPYNFVLCHILRGGGGGD